MKPTLGREVAAMLNIEAGDSAEDNAHLFAAAPEFQRVWALVPLEMAELILAGESERSRELIQKAMAPKPYRESES